ncbi:MAG: anion permease [Eggerthellaceae bacterium]
MSIFVLAITLATGVGQADQMILPIWLMFFCAQHGVAPVGGERIIKSVGLDMVKLEPFQGFAASVATFFCLMLSTFAGLPVSTTHTNTTAIMGVGAAKRKSAVKWGIAVDMVKTWVLTFRGAVCSDSRSPTCS